MLEIHALTVLHKYKSALFPEHCAPKTLYATVLKLGHVIV